MTTEHADRGPLSRDEMARLVARDIPAGSYVNLGIGQPTRVAPSMSVSSRSPTTMGARAPERSTLSACMLGSGLPVAAGVLPVALRSAATSDPLPGSAPRVDGTVASRLVASQNAPCVIATIASARCRQVMSGKNPCTTAAGRSSALVTGRRPRSRADWWCTPVRTSRRRSTPSC